MKRTHPLSPTARIAVVHHSGRGSTARLARSIAEGASRPPRTGVDLLSVDDLPASAEGPAWDVLDRADAIVLGTPTYMAGVSAPFKAFMDATSERWGLQAWRGKLAAGFTNSAGLSGDKLGALQHLSLFAAQHSMVWVSLGVPAEGARSTAGTEAKNRVGSFLGAMAWSPPDLPPEEVPGPADLETGALLGERVARIALGWRAEGAGAERDGDVRAIEDVLRDYFDGLFASDVESLGRALHSEARYVDALRAPLHPLSVDEYLPIVADRESPASRGEARRDRIVSIDFAGDSAAIARVECSIGPRAYTDLLTLVREDGRWAIVSKVFHHEPLEA
ncbi:MAG: nuclear transport factor 2 family protein [Planctomycetota bacterium]